MSRTLAAPSPGSAWLLIGGSLLALPCATLLLAAGVFALGGSLHALLAPAAQLLTGVWTACHAHALGLPRVRAVSFALVVVLAVLGAGAFTSARVLDLGYDSQSYHQLGILELARGWNPFTEASTLQGPYALYAGHYCIGPWLQAALLFLCTGELESAKAIQFLMMAAAFCIANGALLYTGLARGRLFAACVAAALALNPVAVAQCSTFYVDGLLASALTILACCLALSVSDPGRMHFALCAAALVVTVNTKFTGVVYALPLSAAAALVIAWRARSGRVIWRFVRAQLAAVAVATLLAGFHPFVTNTVREGHPFYPLMGAGQLHDIAFHRPARIAEVSRVERLAVSLFADPARDFQRAESLVKWPFSVSAEEYARFGTPDPRVAGWGPLFGGLLVLCVPGVVLSWRRRLPGAGALALVAMLAPIGSALLNAECWWARFSPQLCLVPLVVALALSASRARLRHAFAGVLVGASLANSALVIGAQLKAVPERSALVERTLHELADAGGTVYVTDRWIGPLYRLYALGVPVVEVRDDGDDPDPALARRMPCVPREFPGTMGEVRYCTQPPPTAPALARR